MEGVFMSKKYNQSQNMHFFNFDPVFPPKEDLVQPKDGKVSVPNVYPADPKEGEKVKTMVLDDGAHYNEDGSVTLTFFNPKAKEVSVRYRLHNYKKSDPEYRLDPDFYAKKDYTIEPMTRREDGYWTITISPGVGYHSIYYIVDGVTQINTQGPYIFDGYSIRNFIDIPDDPDTTLQDVPHGSLVRSIYKSEYENRYRASWVYLPPSYFCSDKRYPVLYIQHGGGQNETSWFQGGKIDLILDNLIAQHKAEEMIVVTNTGYSYVPSGEGDEVYNGKLDKVIVEECVPHIDATFRTIADRKHRAVCGLSMGGGHTRRLAFLHPDTFANFGIFSSGECFPTVTADADFTELFNDVEKFNSYFDVAVVACGDADLRWDKTLADLTPYIEKGLKIQWKGYKGQHEWNVWRYCAKDFVQMIFKK